MQADHINHCADGKGTETSHKCWTALLLPIVLGTVGHITGPTAEAGFSPDAPRYRKQWAVIIGINYEGREDARSAGVTELMTPEADAQALAETLIEYYGYDRDCVKLLLGGQATRANIEELLGDRFLGDANQISERDSVLFYFAGHGDRQTKDEFSKAVIWPYDVEVKDGYGVVGNEIEISTVLNNLAVCPADDRLIMLDSCHSGEVFRIAEGVRSGAKYEFDRELFELPVFQAIAASRGFQKALDGRGHSPFTRALLEALREEVKQPQFGASALFSQVRTKVRKYSEQDPRGGTIAGDGEFYFFRAKSPDASAPVDGDSKSGQLLESANRRDSMNNGRGWRDWLLVALASVPVVLCAGFLFWAKTRDGITTCIAWNRPLTNSESRLHQLVFPMLNVRQVKKLMRTGEWKQAETGANLAERGCLLGGLILIYHGQADVVVDGERIAYLSDGQFVGEMGFVSGQAVSADVVAVTPVEYVFWSRDRLQPLLETSPKLHAALQSVIGRDVVAKLTSRVEHSGTIALPGPSHRSK